MTNFRKIAAAVLAIMIVLCVGLTLTIWHFINHTTMKPGDGPWTIQMAAVGCTIAYQMKHPIEDADLEAHKSNPKYRSIFTNGLSAGVVTGGFPGACEPNAEDDTHFEGLSEYIPTPGDGDSPSVFENQCGIAKQQYLELFNRRLGQSDPVTYKALCVPYYKFIKKYYAEHPAKSRAELDARRKLENSQ